MYAQIEMNNTLCHASFTGSCPVCLSAISLCVWSYYITADSDGNCMCQLTALSHINGVQTNCRLYTTLFVKATTFIFTITFRKFGPIKTILLALRPEMNWWRSVPPRLKSVDALPCEVFFIQLYHYSYKGRIICASSDLNVILVR